MKMALQLQTRGLLRGYGSEKAEVTNSNRT